MDSTWPGNDDEEQPQEQPFKPGEFGTTCLAIRGPHNFQVDPDQTRPFSDYIIERCINVDPSGNQCEATKRTPTPRSPGQPDDDIPPSDFPYGGASW